MSQNAKTATVTTPRQPASETITSQEEEILAICRRLLGNQNFVKTDNFFDAGGNSLLAMNLMLELETRLGLVPDLETIFSAPTVGGLYQALAEVRERSPSGLVPIRAGTSNKSLYIVHSTFDTTSLSATLRDDLALAFVLVNDAAWLRAQMAEGGVLGSIARISDAYADVIMTRGRRAPFFLAGHSFGGVLAVETACRLEERGLGPEMVFLFDTYLHRSMHRTLYDIMHNGWLGRKFRQRRSHLGPTAPSGEEDASVAIARMLATLREKSSRSYRGPRRQLQCRTVLFRASFSPDGRRLRFNPHPGWARPLGARFSTVPISGDHFSMVMEPHARELAAEIDRQICSQARLG